MRAPLLFPAALGLVLLAGCAASTPESRLVGVWSIDRSSTVLPTVPKKRMNSRIESLLLNFRVKLLSDHKLVVAAGQVTEGTWSYSQGHLDWKLDNGFLDGLVQDPDVQVSPDESHIDVVGTTMVGPIKISLRKTG